MMEIKDLKPASVFHYFSEVCKVPRPSKKEEQIIAFLKAFGREQGLKTMVDEVGNVRIDKPATPGMEHCKKVILQCHEDMVCEKNADVKHDFLKDPIQPYVEGEWLRAKGTTLGADDGIGIAACLAILAAKDIQHGPIACIFTRDEETGMTGAFGMKNDFMEGDMLINLDSEDEGEMFIGCAGGANTEADFRFKHVPVPEDFYFFRVQIKGLSGGHSGDDIDKGRANANKLLVRFLVKIADKYPFYLCHIDGGNLHNAIPREAHALCAVPMEVKEHVRIDLNRYTVELENEFSVTEPNLAADLVSETRVKEAIDPQVARKMLRTLYAVHNGVYAMSQDIPGLVETSSNLASVKMLDGQVHVVTSQRSSIESQREDVSEAVRSAFLLGGAEVATSDGYPGWKPNPRSEILQITVDSYKRLFGKEPKVRAIHAGLECGLFLQSYPNLDMVSFGPTMRGVHSPDERLLIPTVDMFWNHLLDVLKNIPRKA
ncbi:Xaa-His dipeptidase [Bacteroidetes bacterium oral taxon 272 str. F0290]|nr:Xaa-His dipeptidase [Bacteroidetes bacterium oral taxon 272 str. F0290]